MRRRGGGGQSHNTESALSLGRTITEQSNWRWRRPADTRQVSALDQTALRYRSHST